MAADEERRETTGGREPRTSAQPSSGGPAATSAEDYEPEAIDPVISEPDPQTSLIPVVRPASATEDEEESPGLVRTLTGSIASSWQASREAEAALEWEEYDVEAAEERLQEQDGAEAARHEFAPDAFYEQPGADGGEAPAAEPFPTGSSSPVQGWTDSRSEAPSETRHEARTGGMPGVVPGLESAGGERPDGGEPGDGTGSAAEVPAEAPATQPIRRGSVLRPSRLKEKLPDPLKKAPLFDRSVFDQKVSPQMFFRRIMRPQGPPTTSVPLVAHLTGTPFENVRQAEQPVDSDELATISFVLDLGETLFRYGAGALEVETSIIAVTAAFGMSNTDVDITNQSISLNWAPEGKIPYSRVRVVRSWSGNFKSLAAVHRLVSDISIGRMTRAEAATRLHEITHDPKPYPRWMATVCGAIFASFFAAYLGAPVLDAALGFAATLLVLGTTRRLAAWRVPEFYGLAAGGFVATSIAMGAFGLGAPVAPSIVVSGGLMILLPSARIVSAIQDAINGFPLTAAGRLVSAMIAFAGMTAGIMAAVVVADLLGAPEIDVAVPMHRLYHPAVLVALVFCAAVAAAVVEQTRWTMLLPTGVISALGFLAYFAGEQIGLGERIIPVIGGTVVGALGRVVALRMGAPQLVIAVPAMMFMLPGLMIFRGMYQIAMGSTTTFMMGGLTQLFNALIIIMSIAAGIVLGDVIMRRFTTGLPSNERERARRR
ncbi:threonine/serine exporter ThrE family protein [Nesterenkonia sp. F]|uniref:threonine/serine ThrE exporter family protein n=1 Tax=Nesterenkonia sp. F TaxID=795955 RepID=UPI000255D111|nr:threonine/serine exporter family protein [Nesterenkonia sp. F]